MQNILRASALVMVIGLTACGSDPAPEPTEQIIVKEPDGSAAPTEEAVATIDGKTAFAICSTCHTLEKGGPAKIGPNLHGVIGTAAASVAGFQYSPAMKSSGITWSEAEIDSYITNPMKKVPGTKMAAAGITDAGKRAAIIAYIKDNSAD